MSRTLTQQQYDGLPIEKRRYWKEQSAQYRNPGYEPVTINLEDAEEVIEGLKKTDLPKYPANYSYGWNAALTEALNKLKGG